MIKLTITITKQMPLELLNPIPEKEITTYDPLMDTI